MEGYKPIYVNYNGKQYQIPYCYKYKTFIQKIFQILKLSNIDYEKISFLFTFEKKNNDKFSFSVSNSDEFNTANDIGQNYDKIYANVNLPKNLDIEIKELKQTKKNLIKKFINIRRKNIQLEKEFNDINNKKETVNEIINRFNQIEKSDQSFIKKNLFKKNEKKASIPNNLKIKNKQFSQYDCKFLDSDNIKNQTIEMKKSEISQINPIIYYFTIQNNGKNEWPNDTILKCENDDTEIFFYHSTLKDDSELKYDENNNLYYKFKITIVFKNYGNIQVGKEYKLRAYLVSDRFNRIGNNFGQIIVKVLPDDDNLSNNLLQEFEDSEDNDDN